MVRADATILTMTARKRTPRGVVVHRRDGGVGAVALRLGGDAKDQDRAEQRTEPGDEREGPRTRCRAGRGQATFTGRRRHLVAGEDVQEEVGAQTSAS